MERICTELDVDLLEIEDVRRTMKHFIEEFFSQGCFEWNCYLKCCCLRLLKANIYVHTTLLHRKNVDVFNEFKMIFVFDRLYC